MIKKDPKKVYNKAVPTLILSSSSSLFLLSFWITKYAINVINNYKIMIITYGSNKILVRFIIKNERYILIKIN